MLADGPHARLPSLFHPLRQQEIMSEQLQTALEALRIAIAFALLLPFVGYGVARLTIPDDRRQFAAILYPIVGWCVLVLGMFVANIFLPARIGVIAVILAAGLANAVSLKRTPQRSNVPQEGLLALAAGAALILVALAPHVVQASLGLLSLNSDEEVYYPAINYVLDYPVVGGPHSLSEQFLEGIAVYGWAFQYTAAAVSALTGSLPFHVYPIVTNCLLSLIHI